jgi:hypothetical protein
MFNKTGQLAAFLKQISDFEFYTGLSIFTIFTKHVQTDFLPQIDFSIPGNIILYCVQFALLFIDMLNGRSDVRQISESIPHQRSCAATPKNHILHHGRLETKK